MTRPVSARGIRLQLRSENRELYSSDRAAFFQVCLCGDYDRVLGLLGAGDLVVDLGANVGCFSLLAARAVGPTGLVVAVEADPESVVALSANLALNPGFPVVVVPRAVSDSDGADAGVVGRGVTARVSRTGERPTRTISLGSLNRTYLSGRRVGALKIDIEGGERELMKTPEFRIMLRGTDLVAIEVHDSESESAARSLLRQSGLLVEGPYRETYFLKALGARLKLEPLLAPSLYGFDGLPVCARLIRQWIESRDPHSASRGTVGASILYGLRANRLESRGDADRHATVPSP